MAMLKWDQTGERRFETGVDRGVLYLDDGAEKYNKAFAWNGLTAVTQSPSGAEPTPLYADNIKYLNMMSAEEFGATIEAYTYPPEFGVCDGSYSVPAKGGSGFSGINIGQQTRQSFGFSYRTRLGNDEKGDSFAYKLHLIYGCLAAPSEKNYTTVNDSPEAMTLSWTLSTTPIAPELGDDVMLRPTSIITIESDKAGEEFMKKLEAVLYGGDNADGKLPLPKEIVALYKE